MKSFFVQKVFVKVRVEADPKPTMATFDDDFQAYLDDHEAYLRTQAKKRSLAEKSNMVRHFVGLSKPNEYTHVIQTIQSLGIMPCADIDWVQQVEDNCDKLLCLIGMYSDAYESFKRTSFLTWIEWREGRPRDPMYVDFVVETPEDRKLDGKKYYKRCGPYRHSFFLLHCNKRDKWYVVGLSTLRMRKKDVTLHILGEVDFARLDEQWKYERSI